MGRSRDFPDPPYETSPKTWEHRRDPFHEVNTYDWNDWRDELGLLSSRITSPGKVQVYNHAPDDLPGWSGGDVVTWLHSLSLDSREQPTEWSRSLSGPDTPPCGLGAFALMGPMFDFYKTGRHRVCEWHP